MRIPVRVTLFDVGSGGAPTTTNPHALARLDAVEFAAVNEGGYESLEVRFRAPTRQAARQYLTRLMANVHVDGPRGKRCWEGFVQEVAVTIDGMTTTRSMVDLANTIVVRYKDPNGAQASASPVTSAASIARYGTKCRLINYSTTTATAASNRAAVVLAQIAQPGEKRVRASGSGTPEPGYAVTLTCRGWWDTFGWLLTSSTSTASVDTATQALTLIAAFGAVNPFFSAATGGILATGLSDTSVIEPDSTYAEAIATKLASGTSAQQRVAYGCYENRQITIRPWAKASPTTYAYQQRAGDPAIRDSYGNVVPPWDVRPDRMILLDGVDAQYIRRVRVRLSADESTVELEADESEGVAELLTKPAGAGSGGTSARQAAIERTVHRQAQTRFSGTNGKVDLGGGRIDTGGGSILTGGGHIDTGGGSIDLGGGGGTITLPGGGGTITLPPPSGGGSTALIDGSGTAGALTKWIDADTIGNAVAGTDYVAPGTLSETIDDRVAALLTAGTGISLSYNDAGNSLTIATSGLSEIIDDEVAGLLVAGTGISLSYNDAGNSLTIAVNSLSETIDDRVAALLVAGTGIGLSYNDAANSLTISNTGGTVGGSGTAGRIMQWATGGADAENSTLIKSGAGVLTLAASGPATATFDSSIRLNGAGASSGDVLAWNGTAYAPLAVTPAAIGAAPDNVKYIVQQATSALSAEQALGALATGLLKNTTTTGVLSIATAADLPSHASRHGNGGADQIAIDAGQVTTGALPIARGGTGQTSAAAALAALGGVGGSATATQVAFFTAASTLDGDTALTFDVAFGDLFVGGLYNTNTGYNVSGTQVVRARRTGWGAPTGTATRTTFATSSVTLSQLAERMKALIDDLSTHGLIGG